MPAALLPQHLGVPVLHQALWAHHTPGPPPVPELSLSPATSCGSPGARGCPPRTGYRCVPVAQGIGGCCGGGPLFWGREGCGVWVPVPAWAAARPPPQGSPAVPPLLASEKGPGWARRPGTAGPGPRPRLPAATAELGRAGGGTAAMGTPVCGAGGQLGALRDTGRCRDTGRRRDTARGGAHPRPPGGAPPARPQLPLPNFFSLWGFGARRPR